MFSKFNIRQFIKYIIPFHFFIKVSKIRFYISGK